MPRYSRGMGVQRGAQEGWRGSSGFGNRSPVSPFVPEACWNRQMTITSASLNLSPGFVFSLAGQQLSAVGAAPVWPSLCCGGAELSGDRRTPELHLLPHLPRQWAGLQPSLLHPTGAASQQGLGRLQLDLLPERGSEPHRHCAAQSPGTIGGTKTIFSQALGSV